MVLDTSAIVAIHLREAGFERLIEKIDQASVVAIGVPTMFESVGVDVAIVAGRANGAARFTEKDGGGDHSVHRRSF